MEHGHDDLRHEISIHLVPVLFGDGTRMFEALDPGHLALEAVATVPAASATHLRYQVTR